MMRCLMLISMVVFTWVQAAHAQYEIPLGTPQEGMIVDSHAGGLTLDKVCIPAGCYQSECVELETAQTMEPNPTCDWNESYRCQQFYGDCGVSAQGECVWLPNPGYDACMSASKAQQDRKHINQIRRKNYDRTQQTD